MLSFAVHTAAAAAVHVASVGVVAAAADVAAAVYAVSGFVPCSLMISLPSCSLYSTILFFLRYLVSVSCLHGRLLPFLFLLFPPALLGSVLLVREVFCPFLLYVVSLVFQVFRGLLRC